MDSIPLNSVFVSSYHYADLVESDAAMHSLRNHILTNLKPYRSYTGEVKVRFDDDGALVELMAALFPERFAEKADKLIAKYIEDHPGEEDDD